MNDKAPSRSPPGDEDRVDVVPRLVRIESKLTQLMQFLGMDTDGRNPIKPKKSLTDRGRK